MMAYLHTSRNYDSHDIQFKDEVGEDYILINGEKINHTLDEDKLTKPLMAPRKNFKRSKLHTEVLNGRKSCMLGLQLCYAVTAICCLIGIIYLVVLLIHTFVNKFKLQEDDKIQVIQQDDLVGCTHFQVSDVWTRNFPKLTTETAFRLLDVNSDGVLDVLMGFGTGADGYNVPNIVCDIYFEGNKPCFGGVMALDGKTGLEIWRHYSDHEVFALNCKEDLNNDGINDCVIGGRAGVLQAISGKTGHTLWNFGPQEAKNDIMNVYTPQMIPDQDEDGIVDVLVIHGGDPLANPGSAFRLSGRLIILSGKTGKVIQWVGVPDKRESYYSPQLLQQNDGTCLILFGTGGETHPGGLWLTTLNDIMKGNIKNSASIYQDLHKGIMTPPVIADVNGDKFPDIIMAMFNSTVVAFDGRQFNQIWNTSFSMSETYSTPAAGYFNDDDVPDFFVKYERGPGFPIYYYAEATVLDGKNGHPLLKNSIHDTIGTQASALAVSMEGYGNDLFLYWTADCLSHEGEFQKHDFMKGTNVHEQSRADLCKLKFGTELVTRMFSLSQHTKSPGFLIYSSENRKSLENDNAVNTSAEAKRYLMLHPNAVYSTISDESSRGPNAVYSTISDESNQGPSFSAYPTNNNHFSKIVKHQRISQDSKDHRRIHKFRQKPIQDFQPDLMSNDEDAWDYQEALERLGPILSQSEMVQERPLGFFRHKQKDTNWNRDRPYRFPRLRRSSRQKRTSHYKENSENNFKRFQRHVGPHDMGGIQRIISTGTLAPVLDPNEPNANHSIDVIFATYWFFPSKTQTISPEDGDCIQKKMSQEKERFETDSKYYGMDHDAYEETITKECVNPRQHDHNRTYEAQSDYDPFNIHMGQMTVYRLRLICDCQEDIRVEVAGRRCARVKPFEEQGWAAYMGTHGDGHFVDSRNQKLQPTK